METEDNSTKKINSMMSVWYGIIIGALQGYIVTQNVWKFVRYAELPWPLQKTPTVELNIYIGMTGLAVLLLPLFLSACFFKIGNLANDNKMLGKRLRFRDDWTKLLVLNKLQDVKSLVATIWQHCGPISSLLHLISSVSLLFPQILMESVLVKNAFLSSQIIWKTDLDIMLCNSADINYIKSLPTENGLETRVFPVPNPQKSDGLTLEFINYALALFIFSIRYAQVFWESHKSFSIIFGLQQILSAAHTLISFCTFSVLYKVHITNAYGDSQSSIPFLLDGYITLLLHAITSTILFLSASVMYHLGFIKFTCFVQKKMNTLQVTKSNESGYGMSWSYFPHTASVSIALVLAAAQSPLIHDAYLLYQLSSNKLMILYAVSTVAHFLCWIVLWLALAIPGTWNFRINAVMFQPIEGLNSVGLSAEIVIDRKTDGAINPFQNTLLVVCEGRAFPMESVENRRSVLSLLPRTLKREENIYTERSPEVSNLPQNSMPSRSDGWSKDHKGVKYMAVRKEVTFDDELQSPRYYSPATRCESRQSRKSSAPSRCCEDNVVESGDFDSGEYAFLSGGRGSIMKKFLADNEECSKAREPIYSSNPFSGERKMVTSPVLTIDSSSGVSSAGSQQSTSGPPSSIASCSQYSEGSYSDKRHIAEPTAHYDPAPMRGSSRRSSMRVTSCSPIYECKSPVSKEYPIMVSKSCAQVSPRQQESGIYGKLRWDNSPSIKASPNYESIYGKTRKQTVTSPRTVMDPNELCSSSSKEVIIENLRRPDNLAKSKNSDSNIISPPIPPPLPSLSYVNRQISTISSESPYGVTTNCRTGSGNVALGGILMAAPQLESITDYTDC